MYHSRVQITLVIICFFFGKLAAQKNWVSYSQSIPAKGYENHQFRLKAMVRTEIEDDSASARLWIRVDNKMKDGFFDSMEDRPIRNNQWKLYVIEDQIGTVADRITFGALCEFNGRFFFDDVQLEIEMEDHQWKTVYSTDFENTSTDWAQGIQFGESGKNEKYIAQLWRENGKDGKQSLLISGKDVPNYGQNKKVGKFADVNGIKLYYEIYGNGHPLVVLHGNGGSIAAASTHYPELIKKYKVIAIDSRGQGRSSVTDAELTYDLMASDVNALLDKLGIDSVFIWGQSDGAILGLIMGMDHPKKVKKVLAFGANIQPDTTALFSWFVDYEKRTMTHSKDAIEKRLTKLMMDYPKIPLTKLSRIKAPVLIMAGDRDIIRPEHTLKLFQHIPNSQLCILPGATHGGSWDKQHLFLQMLYDFFDNPFKKPTTEDWFKE